MVSAESKNTSLKNQSFSMRVKISRYHLSSPAPHGTGLDKRGHFPEIRKENSGEMLTLRPFNEGHPLRLFPVPLPECIQSLFRTVLQHQRFSATGYQSSTFFRSLRLSALPTITCIRKNNSKRLTASAVLCSDRVKKPTAPMLKATDLTEWLTT